MSVCGNNRMTCAVAYQRKGSNTTANATTTTNAGDTNYTTEQLHTWNYATSSDTTATTTATTTLPNVTTKCYYHR